jgi:hypothetical protein
VFELSKYRVRIYLGSIGSLEKAFLCDSYVTRDRSSQITKICICLNELARFQGLGIVVGKT